MPMYEYKAHGGLYLYRLQYSEHKEGWQVDAAQIVAGTGEPITAWTPIKGAYSSEAQALARAIEHCEALVAHLNTDNLPDE